MVRNHRVGPPGHGLVGVPVGENCVTWPNGSNVLRAIRIIQEHAAVITISVDAVVVTGIVRVGNVDGRINDASIKSVTGFMSKIPLLTYGM